MKAHELTTSPRTTRKRVGRGISAGGGKTAGRGTKGQNARTGAKTRRSFEGGQVTLMMRIPKKRGFTSKRTPAQVVYTSDLAKVSGATVSNESLKEAGLIKSKTTPVKLIQKGKVEKKFTVKLQGASASAVKAVESAGGSFQVTAIERPKKKSETKK